MSVGRVCIREVDVADTAESVWQAAERMRIRDVGCLVVIGAQNKPVGILTDRDLVKRILAPGRDPMTTLVGDVMTKRPHVIDEQSSIESAISLMRSGRFRRLPVVDRKGQLIGLLCLDDVLSLLCEEFAQIGQLLNRTAPAAPTSPGYQTDYLIRSEMVPGTTPV